jgi:hypothetical protein
MYTMVAIVSLLCGCKAPMRDTELGTLASPIQSAVTPRPVDDVTREQPQAIYAVVPPGSLELDDLQKHPEVAVVTSTEELEAYVGQNIPVWLDANALGKIDVSKLVYGHGDSPLAIVGYNNGLYCFRELSSDPELTVGGPMVEWDYESLKGGFCVWRVIGPGRAWMFGYKKRATVVSILEVTNAIAAGRNPPTPEP